MHMVKVVVLYIIIFYGLLALFAYFLSDKMMFPVPKSSYKDSNRIVKLTTQDDETIGAIYLPNRKAPYIILYSHGNSEDIGHIMPFLEALNKHDFAVFSYDYHGYGISEGSPSEKTTYYDVEAAYDYVTTKLKYSPDRIIVYGRSIGAALAIHLAAKYPVKGLIVQSPFLTAFRVLTYLPLLPFDKYDNLSKIKKIKCPVLVIHGSSDAIVPFYHGRTLYKAIKTPKQFYWVIGAGHNNVVEIAREELGDRILGFVHSLLPTKSK